MPDSPPSHDDDMRARGFWPDRKPADRSYNRSRRTGDGTLATIERMRNTVRWQRVRDAARRRDPLCVACLARGLTTATMDIDHIVPARVLVEQGTPERFYDLSNLRGLCRPCHAREGSK